jgi:hypothetical protein
MNRTQKVILAFLAVADLMVIGLLGSYVLRQTPQDPLKPTPTADREAICSDEVMRTFESAFSDNQDSISVVWNKRLGNIHMKLSSITEAVEIGQSPLSVPLDPSPQVLWVALDTLASRLPEACYLPETITLAISMSTSSDTVRYVVQVEGKYLDAWRRDIINDATFANVARYRTTSPSPTSSEF